LWIIPSLVWSFALVNSTDHSGGKVLALTAKPWFCVVMKQRPDPSWIHGWLWPRFPYLETNRKSSSIKTLFVVNMGFQKKSVTFWYNFERVCVSVGIREFKCFHFRSHFGTGNFKALSYHDR
jgi:hypothetical protein